MSECDSKSELRRKLNRARDGREGFTVLKVIKRFDRINHDKNFEFLASFQEPTKSVIKGFHFFPSIGMGK